MYVRDMPGVYRYVSAGVRVYMCPIIINISGPLVLITHRCKTPEFDKYAGNVAGDQQIGMTSQL